jgi:hypothetical protein
VGAGVAWGSETPRGSADSALRSSDLAVFYRNHIVTVLLVKRSGLASMGGIQITTLGHVRRAW